MAEIKHCYCPRCQEETAHEVYIDIHGYLHSLCTVCGKDVESRSRVKEISLYSTLKCQSEKSNRLHIRYLDVHGYIHWFCLSRGKDIESRFRVE